MRSTIMFTTRARCTLTARSTTGLRLRLASMKALTTIRNSFARAARGKKVHTNSAEGYISVFKRGMIGTYQHCEEQHLHRYLAEFDFRQSNRAALGVDDTQRTMRAVKGAEGKRLMYHQASGQEGAELPPWPE